MTASRKQKELDEQALETAASGTVLRMRQLLDEGASPSARDEETHWTPLHTACYFNNPKLCALLVKRGALVDAKAVDGATPLIIAASLASVEIAELLLNAGAKVNAMDAKGYTPLMLAADRPDKEMSELLLSRDANASMRSKDDMTAMDIARDRGAGFLAAQIEARLLEKAAPAPARPRARMM